MKTQVSLPMGSNGIKKVEIDLEMKGTHLELLLGCSEEQMDRVLVSILNDLLVGVKAETLVRVDFEYLSMMVRIASFGANFEIPWDHLKCGTRTVDTVDLSSLDVKEWEDSFKEVFITVSGNEKKFKVTPPCMGVELLIQDSIYGTGVTKKELINKPESLKLFAGRRAASFLELVDGEVIPSIANLDFIAKAINESSVVVIKVLNKQIRKLESYGVQFRTKPLVCSKCGLEVGPVEIPFRHIIYEDIWV